MKRIILIANISIVLAVIGAALISCSHPGRTDAGFGIYLVENGEIVLSDEHIKYYNKNTHEIELNEKGIKRWESYIPYDTSFDPPIPKLGGLYTKDFAVKLNGKEIYRGKFWSMASSMSCPEIVILDVLGILDNKIEIDVGYPGPFVAKEKDPRGSPEIINYFKKQGLLK